MVLGPPRGFRFPPAEPSRPGDRPDRRPQLAARHVDAGYQGRGVRLPGACRAGVRAADGIWTVNTVTLMRHGLALYGQKKVSLDEAADLHPEGIEGVVRSAHAYADRLPTGARVRVISSPFGRTLHTAKIARSVLEERGHPCSPVEVDQSVEEVRNLKGRVLNALMNGGAIELDGRQVHIDPALTNPRKVPYPDYYVESEFLRLTADALESLPERFVAAFLRFETFPEVTARMLDRVASLLHEEGDEHTLITTHDACTGFPVKAFTGARRLGLEPGTFVVLVRRDDDIAVDYLQHEPEGRVVPLRAEFASQYAAPLLG